MKTSFLQNNATFMNGFILQVTIDLSDLFEKKVRKEIYIVYNLTMMSLLMLMFWLFDRELPSTNLN